MKNPDVQFIRIYSLPVYLQAELPSKNMVPVYNATHLYVPEFNNYYSDISEIRPNLMH